MKKQARVITVVTTTLLQTNIAFAGYYANPGWATGLIGEIGGTLSAFIPAFIGFALLVFIWGVVQFIATSEEKKREEGRRRMVWGLIGLFVIVSVWGLVALIQSLTANHTPTAKHLQLSQWTERWPICRGRTNGPTTWCLVRTKL